MLSSQSGTHLVVEGLVQRKQEVPCSLSSVFDFLNCFLKVELLFLLSFTLKGIVVCKSSEDQDSYLLSMDKHTRPIVEIVFVFLNKRSVLFSKIFLYHSCHFLGEDQ